MPNDKDKKGNSSKTEEKAPAGRTLTITSRYEECTSRDRITSDHSQYLANHKSDRWTDRSSTGANKGRGGKS